MFKPFTIEVKTIEEANALYARLIPSESWIKDTVVPLALNCTLAEHFKDYNTRGISRNTVCGLYDQVRVGFDTNNIDPKNPKANTVCGHKIERTDNKLVIGCLQTNIDQAREALKLAMNGAEVRLDGVIYAKDKVRYGLHSVTVEQAKEILEIK